MDDYPLAEQYHARANHGWGCRESSLNSANLGKYVISLRYGGDCHSWKGKNQEAEKLFIKASKCFNKIPTNDHTVEIKMNFFIIQENLAMFYKARNDKTQFEEILNNAKVGIEELISLLDKTQEEKRNDEDWNNRAICYLHLGTILQSCNDWPEGKACFERAIRAMTRVKIRNTDCYQNLNSLYENLSNLCIAQPLIQKRYKCIADIFCSSEFDYATYDPFCELFLGNANPEQISFPTENLMFLHFFTILLDDYQNLGFPKSDFILYYRSNINLRNQVEKIADQMKNIQPLLAQIVHNNSLEIGFARCLQASQNAQQLQQQKIDLLEKAMKEQQQKIDLLEKAMKEQQEKINWLERALQQYQSNGNEDKEVEPEKFSRKRRREKSDLNAEDDKQNKRSNNSASTLALAAIAQRIGSPVHGSNHQPDSQNNQNSSISNNSETTTTKENSL